MSWFHPPTPVPASTSFLSFSPVPSTSTTSPTHSPSRRPPHPPSFRPRRPRSRHLHMRSPSSHGLFTVSELDELYAPSSTCASEYASDAETVWSRVYPVHCPSARASSELLHPSPPLCALDQEQEQAQERVCVDVPRDVEMSDSEEMAPRDVAVRDAWCAALDSALDRDAEAEADAGMSAGSSITSAESDGASTPPLLSSAAPHAVAPEEADDPFLVDVPLDAVDVVERDSLGSAAASSYANFLARLQMPPVRHRRPPPLKLGAARASRATRHPPRHRHPYALGADETDSDASAELDIDAWSRSVDFSLAAAAASASATATTPKSRSHAHEHHLLPALPIKSDAQWRAARSPRSPHSPNTPTQSRAPRSSSHSQTRTRTQTRTRSPPVLRLNTQLDRAADPASALRALLGACGDASDSDSGSEAERELGLGLGLGLCGGAPHRASADSTGSNDSARLSVSALTHAFDAFPLPPPRTPVLSPASASTTSSFEYDTLLTPRTPHTPARQARGLGLGLGMGMGAFGSSATRHASCPDAPGPKPRLRHDARSERRDASVGARMMADHAQLFALAQGDEVDMDMDMDMDMGMGMDGDEVEAPLSAHPFACRERSGAIELAGKPGPRAQSQAGSVSSLGSTGSGSGSGSEAGSGSSKSKSKRLPQRSRLPSMWLK